jgi:hypothetical protein
MVIDIAKVEKLLTMAYSDMTSDNFDHDFVVGCIAEALARVQGDTGSFDIME